MLLRPGDRLGEWIVDAPLGEGGMGAVFRAHNHLASSLRAAIKVLKPHDLGHARERFGLELQALARIEHPGVVRVLGGGEDRDRGLLYLVMELLEGETLDQRLARGPLSPGEAREIFTALADALAAAHERSIFHRDVKPSNVMLTRAGARLIDFGIARHEGRNLTATGQMTGTLVYLPPEAFQAEADPALADVYALGQCLYEALTGSAPFGELTGGGADLGRLVARKLGASALDPGPGVPRDLREAVRAATEPDPARRTATVRELGAALVTGRAPPPQTVSVTRPLPPEPPPEPRDEAPPDPPPERRGTAASAGRVAGAAAVGLGGVAAAGLAVLGGVGVLAAGAWWWSTRVPPAPPPAPDGPPELAGPPTTRLPSGVEVWVLEQGTGAHATEGARATLDDRVWLPDGKLLQRTEDGHPLVVRLGTGALLRGLDQGVQQLQAGGHAVLRVPPALAYGDLGNSHVPAGAILTFEVWLRELAPPPRLDARALWAAPIDGGWTEGPPEAPVTVVTASDYLCPYCQRLEQETLPKLLDEYGADLRIVHQSFVVHPAAVASAIALCAAAKQGHARDMDAWLWDQVFRARRVDEDPDCWWSGSCPVARELVDGVAQGAWDPGLATCRDEVLRGREAFVRLGVGAVPSSWVNGRYLEGAQPLEAFERVVDSELDEARHRIEVGTRPEDYYQEWVLRRGRDSVDDGPP